MRVSVSQRGLWNAADKIPIFPLNTDGIDPDGRNIWIHNITVTNFDDVVAVKPRWVGSSQPLMPPTHKFAIHHFAKQLLSRLAPLLQASSRCCEGLCACPRAVINPVSATCLTRRLIVLNGLHRILDSRFLCK